MQKKPKNLLLISKSVFQGREILIERPRHLRLLSSAEKNKKEKEKKRKEFFSISLLVCMCSKDEKNKQTDKQFCENTEDEHEKKN